MPASVAPIIVEGLVLLSTPAECQSIASAHLFGLVQLREELLVEDVDLLGLLGVGRVVDTLLTEY